VTIRRLTRTLAALLGGVALALAAGALPAGAAPTHIDPDPVTAQAGTTTTISFKVEHGCDGSPTIELAIKTPEGSSGATAVEKQGWTSSTKDGVVTFTGGALGPDTEDTFGITLTLPGTAGDVAFPIIQTCQQGKLEWIAPTVAGQPEPDYPAPVVKLVEPLVTQSTVPGTTTPPTTAAATPTTKDPFDTGLDTIAGQGGGKEISNGALALGGIVAVLIVIVGGAGFTLWKRRDAAKDAAAEDAAPTDDQP
jgi:uncharacterized protein YcnI